MENFLFIKIIGCNNFISTGVLILSSICEKLNYNPIIKFINLDSRYVKESNTKKIIDILKYIKETSPKFIGFSIGLDTFSDNHLDSLLKLIKNNYPKLPIFIGGPTVEFDINRFKNKNIDVVFYGESEFPFEEILKNWDNVNLSKIPNIAYFKDDNFIINPQTYMSDLNFIETYKYEDKTIHVPGVILSRGCHFSCNHCIHKTRFDIYKQNNICHSKKEYYRRKTPEQSIELIKRYVNHFNLNYVYFYDDFIFTLDDWFKEFLELYLKEINKPIAITGVISNINKDLLDFSKDLIIECLIFGIESGVESIRKSVLGRSYSNKTIYKVIDLIRKYPNIKDIKTSNLIGLHTETDDDIYETIKINAELKIDAPNFHTLYPYKFTQIYKNSIEFVDNELYNAGYNDLKSVYKNTKFTDNLILKFITMKDWFLNLYLSEDTKKIYSPYVEELLKSKIIDKKYLTRKNIELSIDCKNLKIDHYKSEILTYFPYLKKNKNNFQTPIFFESFDRG